ncbi:8-oxoguanine DNA glycosylase OGG fold protein [Cyclobacterium salsum]|uniref:8-oxoguanine DNA glycosylase OGG fold protein n=1 Tax=Cyclobacterium salsum TaxID=2666329 RepID=UPI0013912FF7|nr:hypothetical protein [Cyclobacterium salsum]
MSDVLLKYRKQIQALNPLEDSQFTYNASRWSQLNKSAKQLVTQFEGKNISRKDIINAFKAYYDGQASFLYPFTLTMLWGFFDTGYGTFRTNQYLNTEENRKAIQEAFNASELKEAYHTLLQIKGLNVSYASKLLYFASRAREEKEYALIFDIRVARSMVKLLDSFGIAEVVNITPSRKFKDYERYIRFMHLWADELQVEAENIELFLFKGEFSNKRD